MSRHPELGTGLHYLKPAVPHNLRFHTPVHVGTKLFIQGYVPASALKFDFNFQKGPEMISSDIAFQLSLRFDQHPKLVRNARVGGKWGTEELAMPKAFPFAHNTDFTVVIEVMDNHYNVAVNNITEFEFKHRTAIDFPTHFCIKGDIKISRVTFSGLLHPTLAATIPSTQKIGDIYTVEGYPTSNTADFSVLLQEDDLIDCDVVLGFNPRLRTSVVVRTSREDLNWSDEENDGGMPFYDGKKFELTFVVLEKFIQILVDKHKFAAFRHKLGIENANILLIEKEVSLSKVIIESHDPNTMELKEVLSPTIPANLPIPEGFSRGKSIYITATPTTDSQIFSILLNPDADDKSESLLELHIQFYSNPRQFSLTSIAKDNWEKPDIHTPVPFPFERGVEFELDLFNEEGGFRALINGKDLFTYAHRDLSKQAKYVSIHQDVVVKSILML